MGELLVDRTPDVDLAVVSTALRAQQTWAAVARRVDAGQREDRADLYLATSDDLLTMISGLPTSVASVVVVASRVVPSAAKSLTVTPAMPSSPGSWTLSPFQSRQMVSPILPPATVTQAKEPVVRGTPFWVTT